MKQSDDIGKLFALFDGDKAKQYHEVRETDQQRETIERWPLFKQVRVGSQAASLSGPTTNSSLASSGRLAASAETAPQPVASLRAPVSPTTLPQALAGNAQETSTTSSGDLKSLFQRLECRDEPAASTKLLAAQADQPSGSIRSLFDRLRRP